ncbi:WhiB family transcriptional regulator [Streptomyces sp. A7024]|uniref:Transcriptional regulator WhiB n=1 Tax=Streptomyces coryli TaxID=1128680 RepID=A0A6G4U4A3_9ACTN|nr:WhiB family transcriptional regulator [Streptomyces coryli]
MEWWRSAACVGVDPELFFPVGPTGPGAEQYVRAKQVCARCPVSEECLEWALTTGTEAGVWGGLAEDERRRLQRRRRRADRRERGASQISSRERGSAQSTVSSVASSSSHEPVNFATPSSSSTRTTSS